MYQYRLNILDLDTSTCVIIKKIQSSFFTY